MNRFLIRHVMLHLKGLLVISSSSAKLQIAAKRTVNFSIISKSHFDEQTRPAYIDSIIVWKTGPSHTVPSTPLLVFPFTSFCYTRMALRMMNSLLLEIIDVSVSATPRAPRQGSPECPHRMSIVIFHITLTHAYVVNFIAHTHFVFIYIYIYCDRKTCM